MQKISACVIIITIAICIPVYCSDVKLLIFYFRTDGEKIQGHFYSDDFIYGGVTVSYKNLWPSNRTAGVQNDICTSGVHQYQTSAYHTL